MEQVCGPPDELQQKPVIPIWLSGVISYDCSLCSIINVLSQVLATHILLPSESNRMNNNDLEYDNV